MMGSKMRSLGFFLLCMGLWPLVSEAADPEVLKPRVPPAQIEEARSWKNPFPATSDNIQKGKFWNSHWKINIQSDCLLSSPSSYGPKAFNNK